MIIAIDGPAGSGKSTIAKLIAGKAGYYFLNTGSFYRAITLVSINENVDLKDPKAVLECAKRHDFSFSSGRLSVDGVDVEDKLHTQEIDMNTSFVSSDPELRKYVNEMLRRVTKGMDIVTEGRDTTTLLFPDADYKFYFDASPEVRARRRIAQQGGNQTYEEVLDLICKRDENDRNKALGALKIAKDAVYIDTSYLTIREVCEKVVSVVRPAHG